MANTFAAMTNSTPTGAPKQSSRRRTITLTVGATGLAVAAVAGVSACGSSNSTSSAPASSSAAAPSSSAKPGGHHGNAVFGTIASESPNSWTITKKDGSTVTVTITPQTVFGTKKNPEQATQFTVGELVAVRGQVSGTTITATEISQPKMRPGMTPPAGVTPPAGSAPPSGAPTTN
jgi:ABC-type Fe3+-hydroxamate transport system substrate-binding protein